MLHGIDTIRKQAKQPLQNAQTDIVCVLGTVPTFLLDEENVSLNKPIPVRNYQDAAKFAGANVPDFTMYDALETILTESGGATVYMINVFDETKHTTTVSAAEYTQNAGKIQIPHVGVKNLEILAGENEGIENEDYRIIQNPTNTTIELLSDTFKSAETLTCSYDYADTTKVTAADFVGAVSQDGERSGTFAITNVTQLYGDEVNIIIAPKYSSLREVRDALVTMAEDLKARVYLDVPQGTTVNSAIQGRTNTNNAVDLICSSKNAYMAMPSVYRYNSYVDETVLAPLSPVLAGLRVKLNKEVDIAKSIDNTKSATIKKLEYPIEFILNKENTETNALNGVGIATVINHKGTFRIWGARNCAFPSENGIETFDSVIDTANFIEKTIENGSFECVGAKINSAFIDNVLEEIKAKFNTWKNPETGLILDGNVWYDENLNPAENLAEGQVVFSYDFCPPSVAEHIRYQSYINIQYFNTTLNEV